MIIILSIVGIIIVIYCLRRSFCITGKYITILNLFSIFTLVDIYIPAITGNIEGRYFALNYVNPISDSEVLTSVLITNVSYFLIWIGYYVVRLKKQRYFKTEQIWIKKRCFYFFLVISVLIYFLNLWYEYKSLGDWFAFYYYKVSRIYASTVELQGSFQNIIRILSETTFVTILMLLSIVMSFGDYFSKKEKRFVFLIAVIISILSLSRGTILCLFIGVVTTMENSKSTSIMNSLSKKKKLMKRYVVAGVLFFLLFGGVRNQMQNENLQVEDKGLIHNTLTAFNNTLGSSLIGLTRTVRYSNSGKPLFLGQSYSEMFLSLIPRSIIPNKPQIYGIATLTIANGSPDSTMDAITIPGEIIMNFGYMGLILLLLWGMTFKIIDNMRYSFRLRYFYMAAIFTLASTSSWMSFTGLFAQTKYLVIYYIILKLIIKTVSINKEKHE